MPRHYLPKVNKYVTFAASIPIALSGGVVYCFGLWAPLLKKNYNLSQGQLEAVGAAHNFGAYSSFISGIVYDSLEHRQHVGPRLSLLVGCVINFVGFMSLWGAVTKKFEAVLWQLILIAFFTGNGMTWYDTSPLATNLRNFPASRGTVVGLIKACIGLSSSLYTSAFSGFFSDRPGAFLIFLACVPSLVNLLLIPLINFVPYLQRSELSKRFSTDARFLLTLQLISALALYLMATALVNGLYDVSTHVRAWFAIGALVFLSPVAAIPYDSGGLYAEKAALFEDEDEEERHLPTHTQGGAGEDDVSVDGTSFEDPMPRLSLVPSLTLTECAKNLNFWIIAMISGVGVGSGLAFLNNVAQIVVALGGSRSERSVLVTFFGVASCAGRIIFGVWPEKLLHTYGVPRPIFLVGSAAVSFMTYFLVAFASPLWLYGLSILGGLCFGAHWSLMPSLASEFFGLDNFASIYTVIQLSPAAWGYGLGAFLVGGMYEAIGRKHGDPANTCVGPDCFRASFLIVSGIGFVSCMLASWLFVRSLRIYRAAFGSLRVFERSYSGIDEYEPLSPPPRHT